MQLNGYCKRDVGLNHKPLEDIASRMSDVEVEPSLAMVNKGDGERKQCSRYTQDKPIVSSSDASTQHRSID